MDEETTTGVSADIAGAEQAQPEVAEQNTAVEPTESQESNQEEATTEPTEQGDNSGQQQDEKPQGISDEDWLKAKGVSEDDPDFKSKLIKNAREAEKLMHETRNAGKTGELEKAHANAVDQLAEERAKQTGSDPEVLRRLYKIELSNSINNHFAEHPEHRALEPQMAEIAKTRPHLLGDLDALYAVASQSNIGAVKTQARREALTELASTQTAAVPRGNAVNNSTANSQKITPENVDTLVGQHDAKWYETHINEINAAMAGIR